MLLYYNNIDLNVFVELELHFYSILLYKSNYKFIYKNITLHTNNICIYYTSHYYFVYYTKSFALNAIHTLIINLYR